MSRIAIRFEPHTQQPAAHYSLRGNRYFWSRWLDYRVEEIEAVAELARCKGIRVTGVEEAISLIERHAEFFSDADSDWRAAR